MMHFERIVDLTHALSPGIPSWDADCGFRLEMHVDYGDCSAPELFRVQQASFRLGMGTHIDAPAHCVPGAETVDRLDLKRLVTQCVVIKVNEALRDNYVLMPEEIGRFESANGRIPQDAFVLVCTGWGRFWGEPKRYRNELTFPAVHESTARLLLERNIAGLGTDTLSADAHGKAFPVHRAILGAGKYLVENIANAEELPAVGAEVMILPMKIENGTEAPVRLIGLIA